MVVTSAVPHVADVGTGKKEYPPSKSECTGAVGVTTAADERFPLVSGAYSPARVFEWHGALVADPAPNKHEHYFSLVSCRRKGGIETHGRGEISSGICGRHFGRQLHGRGGRLPQERRAIRRAVVPVQSAEEVIPVTLRNNHRRRGGEEDEK